MHWIVLTVSLLAQPAQTDTAEIPTVNSGQAVVSDYLRDSYADDATKYVFRHDDGQRPALKLVEKPVMRWATDDDWSGDVFVWTHQGRPEVVGCILSGPGGETNRLVFHEFHLLAEQSLAPTDLLTRRRWQPKEGLRTTPVEGAPAPASAAGGRLVQMRQMAKEFTANMEADGQWELRLLPQPLYRYGGSESNVVDGALFAYVWTKGTDPEVILLLECRKTESGLAWHFAPVRFSTRQLWLTYGGKEVWRADSHREPAGDTDSTYTTAYSRTMPRQPPQSDDQP